MFQFGAFQGGAFQSVWSVAKAIMATGGWEFTPRWVVRKRGKNHYFFNAKEALAFYERKEKKKKKLKKVKYLGESLVFFGESNLENIAIDKKSGIELLREAARSVDIAKYIESRLKAQIEASRRALLMAEEEEFLLLAAIVA